MALPLGIAALGEALRAGGGDLAPAVAGPTLEAQEAELVAQYGQALAVAQNRPAEASRRFAAILESGLIGNNEASPTLQRLVTLCWKNRGVCEEQRKNVRTAARCYAQAVLRDGDDTGLWVRLARCAAAPRRSCRGRSSTSARTSSRAPAHSHARGGPV